MVILWINLVQMMFLGQVSTYLIDLKSFCMIAMHSFLISTLTGTTVPVEKVKEIFSIDGSFEVRITHAKKSHYLMDRCGTKTN